MSKHTAYQMLHRSAKVRRGQPVLIHGAAGGVGSALLQLGRLAGLEMYGTCSSRGASAVSDVGVDAVFDGIGGTHIWRSREALRPRGTVVAYGLTSSLRGADRLQVVQVVVIAFMESPFSDCILRAAGFSPAGTARRKVVLAAAALLAAPRASLAQKQTRVWRIGFLTNGTVTFSRGQLDAFVRGLSELGYTVGKNVMLAPRWAEGKLDRLPALVTDLLAQNIDVLFAPSGIAAQAARKSGTTIPIVFALAPDPVGQGFGHSLARPGGNMTGLTSAHTELSAKRIELLKEALPGTRRIAVLYHVTQSAAGVREQLAETERAAKILGVAVITEELSRVEDFERAIASIRTQRPDALVVIENPLFFTNRMRLTEVAATLRIPAIYNVSEYVHAGGLMSYGASYADVSRRAAAYVVKILNGASPGDLPIERPIKFELVINMKAARAMGLTVPRSVLLRADETVD